MSEKKKSVFETLNAIDCSKQVKEKNNLKYLPWSWAWSMVKQNYPTATFKVYENADGLFYHTDGKTAWVKTSVTIEGEELTEFLAIMDYRNKSIPVENLTSMDVNKAIQRCLTKACARHGLGLYIYAGEDLPEEAKEQAQQQYVEKMTAAIFEMESAETIKDVSEVWKKWVKEYPIICEQGTDFFKVAKRKKGELKDGTKNT